MTQILFVWTVAALFVVHVLGHFLAARAVGVRVLTLSLGFGPALVTVRHGDTDYRVGLLPFAGYMTMAGETADEPRSGAPDDFLSRSKWQRFFVYIMGPVMNVMLSVTLTAVLLTDATEPAFLREAAVVGIVATGSPGERSGLQPGDRVVQVGGTAIRNWRDLDLQIGTKAPGQDVEVVYERSGERRSTRVRTQKEDDGGSGIGVKPDMYPRIERTEPGGAADKAGIKAGDLVLAVDGVRMVYAAELRAAVLKKPGVEIDLTIRRDGAEQHVRLTPIKIGEDGRIGVYPAEVMRPVDLNPLEALGQSVIENYQASRLVLGSWGQLLTGETSVDQVQGPVRIAPMPNESSLSPFLAFMSLLSLNLGLLNLLPVPFADGGRIVGILWSAWRKPQN